MGDDEIPRRPGRKRDSARDAVILDAALEILAEEGYERMTVDAVVARAHAGKATVYRRWPSKAHLVHDAIVHMGEQDVDLGCIDDTGTLRGDVLASSRPEAFGEQRLKIIVGLTSMVASDPAGLGAAAFRASVEPWVGLNRALLERAVGRGEISAALDVDLLARLVPSMCMYRISVDRLALDPAFVGGIIDGVLLPAVGLGTEHPAPSPQRTAARSGLVRPLSDQRRKKEQEIHQ